MGTEKTDTPGARLRLAAWQGDLDAIHQLVEQGADANVWDEWGRTALSLAAANGHLSAVTALLRAGAWVDPHEDYDTYETPLIAAAQSGHLGVVQALCAAGANPCLHGGTGQRTASAYARTNGHAAVAEFLRQQEELKRPGGEGGRNF